MNLFSGGKFLKRPPWDLISSPSDSEKLLYVLLNAAGLLFLKLKSLEISRHTHFAEIAFLLIFGESLGPETQRDSQEAFWKVSGDSQESHSEPKQPWKKNVKKSLRLSVKEMRPTTLAAEWRRWRAPSTAPARKSWSAAFWTEPHRAHTHLLSQYCQNLLQINLFGDFLEAIKCNSFGTLNHSAEGWKYALLKASAWQEALSLRILAVLPLVLLGELGIICIVPKGLQRG